METHSLVASDSRIKPIYPLSQVVLCKDKDGKIGLKAKAVNKGVFVCLVARGSPAALGGLRLSIMSY